MCDSLIISYAKTIHWLQELRKLVEEMSAIRQWLLTLSSFDNTSDVLIKADCLSPGKSVSTTFFHFIFVQGLKMGRDSQ
jgi:hypothetical protein